MRGFIEVLTLAGKVSRDKLAKYDQKGSNNNNYKGPSGRGYSADHKAASKRNTGRRCAVCGSTKDLQNAEVKGTNGKKHRTLCRSCHAKYDGFSKNFKK